MPSRLRPTASVATDAIVVGDPGRALMLAQELLQQPKMSNHARGLWGYTGLTPGGHELTVQSTGIGGPSAAVVLTDLGELGVRRAIRIGTCTALAADLRPGEQLLVTEAHAWGRPGERRGGTLHPGPGLTARLRRQLGEKARAASVASLDVPHGGGEAPVEEGDAADMQTAALVGRASALRIAFAAVLIVAESTAGEQLDDEGLQLAAKDAGCAVAAVLSA